MQSAFGVDHGEISKGRWSWGRAARPTTAAQAATAGKGGMSGPQKAKGFLHKVGEAPISIKGIGEASGKAAGATGRFFEKRPGLTGTALAGGAGYGGYRYLRDKEPRKKKS